MIYKNNLALHRLALLSALLFYWPSSVLAGQTLPDAGAVTRDAVPTPSVKAPRAGPVLPESDYKPSSSEDTTPIEVKGIKIQGATVFSESELQKIVEHFSTGTHTLGELQFAAVRITAHYRKAGYFLARAYLPKQSLQDGVVTIKVLEGSLGELKLENNSRVSDEKANAMLGKIEQGKPVQNTTTNRALLLLSDLPGVDNLEARVEPGANTGETNLVTSLSESRVFSGGFEFDNYGSLYSGRYRVGGNINLNSPFGYGEQLSTRLLISDEDLIYGRLGAQVPISSDGLTLSGGYNRTQYSLGDTFDPLDARGNSDTVDLTLRYPFIRSQKLNVYGSLSAEYRKLQDEIHSTNTKTDKNAKVGNAAIYADWRDALGGGAANQAGITFSHGDLNIETASAALIDAVGAKTEGSYSKWNWNLSRQQAITQKLSANVQARGQFTSDNLDSAEKFVLGGPFGVRAYPTGEGAADIGWLINAELRYVMLPQLSASIFYDAGGIEVNADPFLTTDNTRDIAGYGLGLSGFYKAFDWRATAAWRTKGESVSEPDKRPRFWLHGGWGF